MRSVGRIPTSCDKNPRYKKWAGPMILKRNQSFGLEPKVVRKWAEPILQKTTKVPRVGLRDSQHREQGSLHRKEYLELDSGNLV